MAKIKPDPFSHPRFLIQEGALMMGNFVIDLCGAAESPHAVLVNEEGMAFYYQVAKRRLISCFKVIHDYGGSRVAMTPDGQTVLTAACSDYGVACYQCIDGALLWRRKNLRKTHEVRYDAVRHCWVVTNIASGARLLNPDGTTRATVNRTLQWFADATAPVLIRVEKHKIVLSSNEREKQIVMPIDGYGILDACLYRQRAFVSECRGPLRCLDAASGEVIWRMETPRKHYLSLSYNADVGLLYGYKWKFPAGMRQWVDGICPDTGRIVSSVALNSDTNEAAFCDGGRYFVSGNFGVIRMATGTKTKLPREARSK